LISSHPAAGIIACLPIAALPSATVIITTISL